MIPTVIPDPSLGRDVGLDVVELFAGVGGFRLGLEQADQDFYRTRWFNQWEPSTKIQRAHDIYAYRFYRQHGQEPPELSNTDIFRVTDEHMDDLPDHQLLVGGFPCQDYSVATTLDKSKALEGPKGMLWWAIDDIIAKKQPEYVLLENVNTLITKPSKQRGRSFGVILSCLRERGYHVEWRVLNAAEVGYAQRRRRVFIFATRKDTGIGQWMADRYENENYLAETGFFGAEFPGKYPTNATGKLRSYDLQDNPRDVSDGFRAHFESAGVMIEGHCLTRRVTTTPSAKEGAPDKLVDILEKEGVDDRYFIDEQRWPKWEYQKGPKAERRVAFKGTDREYEYMFKEGAMAPIDAWEKPARTLLTSEANKTPNRSTHIVIDPKTKRKRFLTPRECELLNGFPAGWTDVMDVTDRWRYFTMGNALVVDLVEQMGRRLKALVEEHDVKVAEPALAVAT